MGKKTAAAAAAGGGLDAIFEAISKRLTGFGVEGLSLPKYKQEGCGQSAFPYLEAILIFSFLVFAWELYLDYRQYRCLEIKTIPTQLASIVKELDDGEKAKGGSSSKGADNNGSLLGRLTAKFDAARAYSADKMRFGFVQSLFAEGESTALLLLGAMPWLWDQSTRLAARWGKADDEYVVSLAFMLLNTVYEQVVHLPFSLYSQFVVEARHGFNKQTIRDFFLDKVKAIILSALLGGPLLVAVLYVIKRGGPNFFVYLWLLVFSFQLFFLTIYPVVIAPLFNKYEPLKDLELKAKIEALAAKVSFPLTKLFVVDGSRRSAHSNAYFYGFFKNKRIVLFDTLLTQVTDTELCSILAHELGHWARSHTLQMFVASNVHIFLAFYVFAASQSNTDLYASFGFASKPTLMGLFLFFQTIWAPIDKVLSVLITVWTRVNEFQADEYAVDLNYADDLCRGLVKLGIENLSNPNPDRLYSSYHYSHPPLAERLAAIQKRQQARAKRE